MFRGAGHVLGAVFCGETCRMHGVPRGCAPWRNVWDAGDASVAVLCEGPCGFLWGVREDLGLCSVEGHAECLALHCGAGDALEAVLFGGYMDCRGLQGML